MMVETPPGSCHFVWYPGPKLRLEPGGITAVRWHPAADLDDLMGMDDPGVSFAEWLGVARDGIARDLHDRLRFHAGNRWDAPMCAKSRQSHIGAGHRGAAR